MQHMRRVVGAVAKQCTATANVMLVCEFVLAVQTGDTKASDKWAAQQMGEEAKQNNNKIDKVEMEQKTHTYTIWYHLL